MPLLPLLRQSVLLELAFLLVAVAATVAETTTTGPRIDNLNATLSRSPQEGDDDNVVDYTINESGGDGRGVHLHLIKNSLTNQYPGNYILYRGTVNGKDRASSVAVTINADGHMSGFFGVQDVSYFIRPPRNAIASNQHMLERHIVGKSEESGQADNVRFKRSTRDWVRERTVEVLVVVDFRTSYEHGRETEQYALTLMNMVNGFFRDASIGHNINIQVSRLSLLDRDEFTVSENAHEVLSEFCKWTAKLSAGTNSTNQYDIAVLITGGNLCQTVNGVLDCSLKGHATIEGACTPGRNCIAVADKGMSATAYAIAHGIGHSMGMIHDSAPCEGIMSSERSRHFPAYGQLWSECSRRYLENFLKTANCLDNKVEMKSDSRPTNAPPSEPMPYSSPDEQCRLASGDMSKHCTAQTAAETCRRLLCQPKSWTVSTTESCYPANLNAPAADGTVCSPNKVCFQGKCLRYKPTSIEGGWGKWQSWSDCSRTCGTGVSVSKRPCTNPRPAHGGAYCTGPRARYKLCSTSDCPPKSKSFRRIQCEENRTWPRYRVPSKTEAKGNPCQLSCETEGSPTFRRVIAKEVRDGTECRIGGRGQDAGICISGLCEPIGCDKALGSSLVVDRCGVCGGRGDTCRIVSVTRPYVKQSGHRRICSAPRGATNIDVKQLRPTNNTLDTRVDEGWLSERYKGRDKFVVAGTNIRYCSERKSNGILDRFTSDGPLRARVEFFVNVHGPNLGIECKYTLPRRKLTPVKESVASWVYEPWSECSANCGEGFQNRTVVCVKGTKEVNESRCQGKPSRQRKCTKGPCSWEASSWGRCSKPCDVGFRKRSVQCRSGNCRQEDKPMNTMPCKLQDCSSWKIGQWSPCSSRCREGTQWRDVTCPRGRVCRLPKPENSRTCEGEHNDCVDWVIVRDYGTCKCNTVWQSRTVVCPKTNEELCYGYRPKPPEMRLCNKAPCYVWRIGPWSKSCSVSCGTGVVNRTIVCVNRHTNASVKSKLCSVEDKPIASRMCRETRACPLPPEDRAPGDPCIDANTTICTDAKIHNYCDLQEVRNVCCFSCRKTDKRKQ
ncbi:A disintegrin and metalloproteinase with thrombospondin motifs 6-like [Oscarella lobularis]|uniref:A disintegrin and metalloproteinase with thrombospondin motifs 6-like n=1 Tax=Oscarella lobularis TaxID=121494 RepID=UPI003313F94C